MNKVSKFAIKFRYLILRKIVKIVATLLIRRKWTKLDFGWAPADPNGGAYSTHPDSLAGF